MTFSWNKTLYNIANLFSNKKSNDRNNIVNSYCHDCKRVTNHKILHAKREFKILDTFAKDYQIVQCCGCETLSFRLEEVDLYDRTNPIDLPKTYTFPYHQKDRSLYSSQHIPNEIYHIYHETITSFNNNCLSLAAVGCRSTIEAICKHEKITERYLINQIDKLKEIGFITTQEREYLHAIRFIGNDSVHNEVIPHKKDVSIVIDIVEHLLYINYIFEYEYIQLPFHPIRDFDDFLFFINAGLKNYKLGEEVTIEEILKKEKCNILPEKLSLFMDQFISLINSDKYSYLKIKDENGEDIEKDKDGSKVNSKKEVNDSSKSKPKEKSHKKFKVISIPIVEDWESANGFYGHSIDTLEEAVELSRYNKDFVISPALIEYVNSRTFY